ncbi:MAG: glycosyltransferase family 2 protein [Candidatus Bathyarchaeia archaeon]
MSNTLKIGAVSGLIVAIGSIIIASIYFNIACELTLFYIISFFLLLASAYYFIIVWNFQKPTLDYDFFPRVSLMAYGWESGNVIERKIENYLAQDYPKDKFEVIIYDNKSIDETPQICRRYEKEGLIEYYTPLKFYDRKAPVLDRAIEKYADREVVALTDPDGVCEKDWTKKIMQPFKDPRVGAVVGVTHCGNYPKNLFLKFRAIEDEWWYHITVLGRNGKIKITDFQPICGANYALRKAAWEDVDRSHGNSLVEDYEMTLRLFNKGWRIAAVDAHVWQEEVEDIGQYMRQRRRWYSSNLKDILRGKRKIAKSLGALPISMQSVTFLSLIYFILVCFYQAFRGDLSLYTIFFALPFLLNFLSVSYGLLKAGKSNLIWYVPLFLTFDSALQLFVFLETKFRYRQEMKWVKLVEGKYYHVGTELKMD